MVDYLFGCVDFGVWFCVDVVFGFFGACVVGVVFDCWVGDGCVCYVLCVVVFVWCRCGDVGCIVCGCLVGMGDVCCVLFVLGVGGGVWGCMCGVGVVL